MSCERTNSLLAGPTIFREPVAQERRHGFIGVYPFDDLEEQDLSAEKIFARTTSASS